MRNVLIGIVVLIVIISIAGISYATNFIPRRTIEEKKEILENRVDAGIITQEEADEIETKLKNCDGTGQEKIGQEYNVYFGQEYVNESESTKANYINNGQCQYNGQGINHENKKGQNKNNSGKNGTGICKRLAE